MFLLHRCRLRCIGWTCDLLKVDGAAINTAVDIFAKRGDVLGKGPMWSLIEQALYWIYIAQKLVIDKRPALPIANLGRSLTILVASEKWQWKALL